MTTRKIPVKGYRLNKAGQLVKDERRLDVSTRLKRRASKRVKAARKATIALTTSSRWRSLTNSEVKQNIAWAKRVLEAPHSETTTLAHLLAAALNDTAHDLLRERGIKGKRKAELP